MRKFRCLALSVGALCLMLVFAGTSLGLSLGAGGREPAKQERGDAPDGRPTGYGPIGMFPSLEKSNGARAAKSSTVGLGRRANKERNARLVNRDPFDDGVTVDLSSCEQSEAFLIVNKKQIKTAGKAYVNLFFDWDRNGKWGGKPRACGRKRVAEWAVKNFSIDLSRQTRAQEVYRVPLRAGPSGRPVWYRAILSLDQRWRNGQGAGAFRSGEVEDYVTEGMSTYSCRSRSLAHGTTKVFKITRARRAPKITGSNLVDTTPGFVDGSLADDGIRRIERFSLTEYTYTSNQVHFDGPRRVPDRFKVSITNARGKTLTITCRVTVLHGPSSTPGEVEDELILKLVHGSPIPGAVQTLFWCLTVTAPASASLSVDWFLGGSTSVFTNQQLTLTKTGKAQLNINTPIFETGPTSVAADATATVNGTTVTGHVAGTFDAKGATACP